MPSAHLKKLALKISFKAFSYFCIPAIAANYVCPYYYFQQHCESFTPLAGVVNFISSCF